jgi:hypothetical protein
MAYEEVVGTAEKVDSENTSAVLTVEDRTKFLLEVWKKTVDVQQHFNDVEMRIRNLRLQS